MPFGHSGSISVCIAVYGIGPSRSATGSAASRNERKCASASSTGPAETAISAITFLPCHSSGTTGSGGAVVRLSAAVMSSGTPGAHSRNRRISSASCSAEKKISPA